MTPLEIAARELAETAIAKKDFIHPSKPILAQAIATLIHRKERPSYRQCLRLMGDSFRKIAQENQRDTDEAAYAEFDRAFPDWQSWQNL